MDTQSPRRVLLVDDDADIRTVASISLRAVGGLIVEPVDGGPAALDALDAFRPDVVLLDVMMPGMDGFATLGALRERLGDRALPVIFMTARAQRDEIQQYLDAGARGVILKPFDPMRLPHMVTAVLDGARVQG